MKGLRFFLMGAVFAATLSCADSVNDRKKGLDDGNATPEPKISAVIGDFNKDGKVNESDLDIFRQIYDHYPQGCGADSDCDGSVDGADFLTWQRNFGKRIYKAGDIDQNGEITMDDLKAYQDDPSAVNVDLDR